MESRGTFFREIHKNSWIKKLTNEGKRVTVGPKKSERIWIVFCVHDDTDALLEGYAEPKLAPSHNPEWTLPLQNTQHISHALVHNEKEFEFVITLTTGVFRFHATTWESMQEWVEVLRQKLREMKILSPRENLYTKLPETRVPLLPTRDPTSPLPATPPVPAAIVPGVECITVPSTITTNSIPTTSINLLEPSSSSSCQTSYSTYQSSSSSSSSSTSSENFSNIEISSSLATTSAVVHHDALIHQYPVHSPRKLLLEQNKSINNLSDSNRNIILQQESSPLLSTIIGNHLTKENIQVNNISDIPRISIETGNKMQIINTENSIRVDVPATVKTESSNSNLFHYVLQKSVVNPTSSRIESQLSVKPSESLCGSSLSITSSSNNNGNIIEEQKKESTIIEGNNSDSTNIMIIQVSNPEPRINQNRYHGSDIFKFSSLENLTDLDEYKSNVNIIPSCLDDVSSVSNTQYSSPIKISNNCDIGEQQQQQRTTTVKVKSENDIKNEQKVHSDVCLNNSSENWQEKIILSTNTSGVTSISVGNDSSTSISVSTPPSMHYDKVFLASSSTSLQNKSIGKISKNETNPSSVSLSSKPDFSKKEVQIVIKNNPVVSNKNKNVIRNPPATPGPSSSGTNLHSNSTVIPLKRQNSPLVDRKKSKPIEKGRENVPPQPSSQLTRRGLLTRGATEAVITARPSRVDIIKRQININNSNNNKNSNVATTSGTATKTTTTISNASLVNRTRSESFDRRRRSSSASETDRRLFVNNVDSFHQNQQLIQQQQIQRLQPFRLTTQDNNKSMNVSKKLTLREQQVIQLRREIMHPGGVRLQLRKKDCLGSIAWVDVFGTVWVAGWKQKDHPMLYNALHIGDQLISIAGITIKTAAEANKIIRNSNTLFLEILIRRIPFGRVYAIKREIEGQCLGLIRDGNSATIVDVVPNSLSARHGLTPKAKSCDGLSLTFWVLTEINGRPLNLFCKENEVYERLNSVGKDISILVQPLDLITKLRKQLKSLRSFKDYIIQ